MSFSIVIVNYKTYEMTKMCLELIHELAIRSKATVWVVDNDSQDKSTDYLRSLYWIKLIERTSANAEKAYLAHGRALDLVLERDENQYLFLMHTDTFIKKPEIFSIMLDQIKDQPNIAAVGCLEQIMSGRFRRVITRFLKHYMRLGKLKLGFKSEVPRGYKAEHVKSFFALWDTNLMRQHKLSFSMESDILGHDAPGYLAQDKLKDKGFSIIPYPVTKIFEHLDHIEGGTRTIAEGRVEFHKRWNR